MWAVPVVALVEAQRDQTVGSGHASACLRNAPGLKARLAAGVVGSAWGLPRGVVLHQTPWMTKPVRRPGPQCLGA